MWHLGRSLPKDDPQTKHPWNKARGLRFPCGSTEWYNFFFWSWPTGTLTATAVDFTEAIYRNVQPPALLPEASSLPVVSFSSARKEPKVFSSRPPSRHCWPPPAPRGSLRPLKPAPATAPSWTLTLRGSSPQTAAALAQTPRCRHMARVAPRSANAKPCTSPTRPSKTPLLLPLWTLAPSPKGAEPFLPPCTDCERQRDRVGWKDATIQACMQ